MGEIHLRPEGLRRTGVVFRDEAEGFTAAVERFESRAPVVDDAFGVMMESTETLQRYLDMTHDTVDGLRTLQRVVAGFGTALDQCADDWQAADSRSAVTIDGLMRHLEALGRPGDPSDLEGLAPPPHDATMSAPEPVPPSPSEDPPVPPEDTEFVGPKPSDGAPPGLSAGLGGVDLGSPREGSGGEPR